MGHCQIQHDYTGRLLSQLRYKVSTVIQRNYAIKSGQLKGDTGATEHLRLVINQQHRKFGSLFHLDAGFLLVIRTTWQANGDTCAFTGFG